MSDKKPLRRKLTRRGDREIKKPTPVEIKPKTKVKDNATSNDS